MKVKVSVLGLGALLWEIWKWLRLRVPQGYCDNLRHGSLTYDASSTSRGNFTFWRTLWWDISLPNGLQMIKSLFSFRDGMAVWFSLISLTLERSDSSGLWLLQLAVLLRTGVILQSLLSSARHTDGSFTERWLEGHLSGHPDCPELLWSYGCLYSWRSCSFPGSLVCFVLVWVNSTKLTWLS